ncbi:flagellar basal-body MS-ring/collar protein FliF [Chitinimonas sp. BJB300]|uniref:flagellar basal-body MS-ring/collar protein FliF n=1 Tax=Chitinimonas sp. BJB300 TaxID=1559339 RepID=UPI000C0E18DC|nr:flagellar basal-body MS-ring/collar protein FliF [Chitinimonas sp. BJB300]PHV13096.1 flagellar M-ring protein FliF [Chitinimonas sp. BJB300]TSJ84693.1 flagellar basal body M-ring protein FliF [Chitinimonas sp. BJB300]
MDDAVLAVENREASQGERPNLIQSFNQLPNPRKLLTIVIAAAVLAAAVIGVMWAREPGYKILFTNVSDKDGGQIIQSLQQQNIPYKLDAGGVISVPGDVVHNVRLQLASQGLPKGGMVGFELLDNQKFGISQFGEQVNYQRAVEGELARSIESLSAVASARVHLAIPKQTVYLREQQKPTASVLLTLHPGRMLDGSQAAGIVHLVSSSVPDLPIKNVTIVDQNGNLLSNMPDFLDGGNGSLNQRQMILVQQQEELLSKRIQKILEPIVGADNVKAEVTVQMDFSEVEQASEQFKPNSPPNASAIRSEQSAENSAGASSQASGVPGALSNQPPGAASAPITLPNPPGAAAGADAGGGSSRKELTRNYEVDKKIEHVKQQVGILKRINAAVVVNFKRVPQKDGGIKSVPLTQPEINQITNLVQEAVGYNKDRGDSVKVVNAAFADRLLDIAGKSFFEKLTEYLIAHTTDLIKVMLIALVLVYLLFGVVRPILRDVIRPNREQRAALAGQDGGVALTAEELAQSEVEAEVVAEAEAGAHLAAFSEMIQRAKEMAKEDPRMVATVIREWLTADPADQKAQ